MNEWMLQLGTFMAVYKALARAGKTDEIGSQEFRRVLAQFANDFPILVGDMKRWILAVANQDCYGKQNRGANNEGKTS